MSVTVVILDDLMTTTLRTRSQAVARIADVLPHSTLGSHMTSSVTWPSDSPYAISYWWSFGSLYL